MQNSRDKHTFCRQIDFGCTKPDRHKSLRSLPRQREDRPRGVCYNQHNMIGYLEGEVRKTDGVRIIVLCGGVGYEVWWAGEPLLPGDKAIVWIYYHSTDKSVALYGFPDERSKSLFELLLKVSGVGPRSAYSIVAALGYKTVTSAIASEEESVISGAPGVGKKLAKRIVAELHEKIGEEGGAGAVVRSGVFVEAEKALVDLGYSKDEVRKALVSVEKAGKTKEIGDVIKATIREITE